VTNAPLALAKQLLAILAKDALTLKLYDDYLHGRHPDPYMPDTADAEYKLIAKRSVSNWMPLLVSTPCQALYVDGFRRGGPQTEADKLGNAIKNPEWDHWQRSRMDARQGAIYQGALAYGHSFTVTLKKKGKAETRGLSARKTAALFEDPANDETPYAALTIDRYPSADGEVHGSARLWDGRNEYVVRFKSHTDGITVANGTRHGASECPVTRFAASVDLDGRTIGVIGPMMALQDRINQTVFDLLITQTGGAFQVRTATGMAPPLKMRPVYEDPNDTTSEIIDVVPMLDQSGNPIPADVNLNAKRFLFAEDSDVEFGVLPASPLAGYIESIDMSIRHLSAISQTPPHFLLGQIANLSAEALTAAEISLQRKIEAFRKGFGESWERVFRLAAELEGIEVSDDDFSSEVIWRDMESKSLAQSADALGKLKDQLGIPAKGLWKRVPNVTQTELNEWSDMADEDPEIALALALKRATVKKAEAEPKPPTAPAAPKVTPAGLAA